MYLPNAYSQLMLHRSFRADGVIATTGTAQLVLPISPSRAALFIQNTGSHSMYMEHGPARATAAITNGTVTSITVANAGFGYTTAPTVEFAGGFGPYVANSSWNGLGLIGSPSPQGLAAQGDSGLPVYNRPAVAHCVMSAGAVSSIVIDDPGYGYINPPEPLLYNSITDPFGCALPATSGTIGILIAAGATYISNPTAMWTDQVALVGTANDTFVIEYMV